MKLQFRVWLGFFAVFCAASAFATSYTWYGTLSGDWFTAGNWSAAGLPVLDMENGNTNHIYITNSGANPLVYDLSACNGAAFVDVKFWTNATPDVCAYNDTMRYRQEISNYYSYDDGSAEAGYSLNAAGSKMA